MSANLTTTQLINETTNNVQSSTSALPTTADVSTTMQALSESTSSSASFSSTPLATSESSPTDNDPDMTSSTPLIFSSIMTMWDSTTKQQGVTTNERTILALLILIDT